MKNRQIEWGFVAAFAMAVLAAGSSRADELLLCSRINAKQMPPDFAIAAMRFTGPSGDGRRGSAGFVVKAKQGEGTRLSFSFQRDATGYGFQVIHPLGKGHVLVSVQSGGVTIHRGGSWGDIGWGNPATSEQVELNADAMNLLSLEAIATYQVISELSPAGKYRLVINDKVICGRTIERADPLVLKVPQDKSVWGGSGWDRTPFAGEGFAPKLRPGHVGLILGPMDGSGPNQNLQDVRLTTMPPIAGMKLPQASTDLEPLFQRIDHAREFGTLVRSKTAGGPGGGPFESTLDEPTLLVGFEYTLSTFYGGHLTVKSFRPIYQTRQGETLGEWHGVPHGEVQRVKAKAGYVVTAIVARHGHRLDGMRLLYMRVRGAGLNPDDAYRSKWIGGQGGGCETLYATYGQPIVSIFGRQGHDLDAIGFAQVDTE
jgi:hypothetical protein